MFGGAQDGDEDRGFADFPREGIDDRHRLASIVDKERLARAVALPHDQIELPSPPAISLTGPAVPRPRGVAWPHHQIEFPSPRPIGLTELAVLEAIGGHPFVFLPQQEQGDTLAFE